MTTTVSNIGSTTATTAASSVNPGTSAQEQQDRFLKLLVSQMKNQDPLNPMDNAQVTQQMAQISTVNGITGLNTTMQSMLSQINSSQLLQATSLTGRDVLVPGNSIAFDGTAGSAGFELAKDAAQVSVKVLDANGNIVHTAALGAQGAGLHTFTWDGALDAGGTAPAGQYTFRIDTGTGGPASTALAYGRVQSASLVGSGLTLDLGSLGFKTLSDVKQVQ